jgi:tRNA G18 (ribose-2'-O)-methylase SpoU
MRKLQHHEIPRADPAATALLPRHPLRIIADNIRSIHNVGSIFRSSDAAGIEHLHLCGFTGTPEDRKLAKTALGAEKVVPWTYHEDAQVAVDAVKSLGFTIAVLELTTAPVDVESLSLEHFPLALVIGNEIDGVSDQVVDVADIAIEIPQYGTKQSLNVSVAAGIAAFDLVRIYRRLADLPHLASEPRF